MAMAKVKPKVGTEPFTFPKPALEGLGFNFSVVLFSFSIPLKISVFCRDCRNLVCPCGWGRHGFPYEFQLQTWPRSSEPWEQGSSGGWSCSPPMEGLGRKRLPTNLGSPGLPTTLLAGSSIPHRLLALFPQSHTWSHSVETRWHYVCLVSLSPAPCPSSSASLCNLWERGHVSPTQEGDRGHAAGTPRPRHDPRSVPASTFSALWAPTTLLGSLPPLQCGLL